MKPPANYIFNHIPTYKELMTPIMETLVALGGSAAVGELNEKVIASLNLPREIEAQIYEPDGSGQPKIKTNLSWARSYLKKSGHIDNSQRGIWSITVAYNAGAGIDPETIAKQVKLGMTEKIEAASCCEEPVIDYADKIELDWKEQLRQVLLQLKPDAFERLVMRVLRESGFVQVEVTGRSGDGGIDGKGIAKLQGILSFHVVFQCKRYKDSISSSLIRDFRGAMIGRADKGLFITTGAFTNEALKEATRAGAPPIDLVDGEDLCLMLKNLNLGVNVRMVEEVTVNTGWFEGI